jgi:hypothetical protein
MQRFSADARDSFLDKINLLFGHENMKKLHSKVAHNRPKSFFFSIANIYTMTLASTTTQQQLAHFPSLNAYYWS